MKTEHPPTDEVSAKSIFRVPTGKHLDGFADRTVFQTREWLQFVSDSQSATPVIGEMREGQDVLGYFTGLTFSKFGLKVLGSSFPGWTTPYIGFNLHAGRLAPRRSCRGRSVGLGRSEVPAHGSLRSILRVGRRRGLWDSLVAPIVPIAPI